MTIQCVFASLSGPAIDLKNMPILAKKKSSSDLGGHVNKQNGAQKTHRRTQNESLFRANFGPETFFLENEQGGTVTINGDRYRAMLNKILFTKIEEQDIGNIWLQQDGATNHTAEATLDGLRPVFDDRIISRRADVVCPSRSCDLKSLDYYLKGAVKGKCYTNKPVTIDVLKDNICESIGEIQLQSIMCLKIGPIA